MTLWNSRGSRGKNADSWLESTVPIFKELNVIIQSKFFTPWKEGVEKEELASSSKIKEFEGLIVGFTKFYKFWKKALTPWNSRGSRVRGGDSWLEITVPIFKELNVIFQSKFLTPWKEGVEKEELANSSKIKEFEGLIVGFTNFERKLWLL
jgi:hypothetical protein